MGGEACPIYSVLARICRTVPVEGGAWVCYFGYRFVLCFLKAEGSNGSRIPHYIALHSSLLSSSLKYTAAFYGSIIMALSYSLILWVITHQMPDCCRWKLSFPQRRYLFLIPHPCTLPFYSLSWKQESFRELRLWWRLQDYRNHRSGRCLTPRVMGCAWELGRTRYCLVEESCSEVGDLKRCVCRASASTASPCCV